MCISLKFRIFAISFQQLPHSVIDWGTIKNIITNNDSNAYDILDALCISIFACDYYFSTSYCLLLWCCLSFIPTIVFRLFGIAYNLNLQFGIKFHFSNIPYSAAVHFQIAVFFEIFFYKTTDYSRGGSRNYGIMEIELRCQKTKVVRQKEGSSRPFVLCLSSLVSEAQNITTLQQHYILGLQTMVGAVAANSQRLTAG